MENYFPMQLQIFGRPELFRVCRYRFGLCRNYFYTGVCDMDKRFDGQFDQL